MAGDVDREQLEAALTRINAARSRAPAPTFEADLGAGWGNPAHGLVVYGTLAPGRENHHLLSDLGGEWLEVTIRGEIGEWMGYPMFRWIPGGAPVAAWVLRSSLLPEHYGRLDDFETNAYARHLVTYDGPRGIGIANCYVAAPSSA